MELQNAFREHHHLLALDTDADSIDEDIVYRITQRGFKTLYAPQDSFFWHRTRINRDMYELFFDIPLIVEMYVRFSLPIGGQQHSVAKRQRIY